MTTGLKTVWDKFVACEIDSTLVIGNRDEQGSWETFEVETHEADIVSFKSAHGTYLCAEPNGKLVHRYPNYKQGDPPGPWEKFKCVKQSNNSVALQTAHGTYIVAETPEDASIQPYTIRHRIPGGGHRIPGGGEPGSWETFVVAPWWNSIIVPVPGEHVDPIIGSLRLLDGGRSGCADSSGPRIPFGVHAGDLLARYYHHDKNFIAAQLDYFASQGVHFVRTWTHLYGSWWATPPRPGEIYPEMDRYWETVREFAKLLRKYKIQWLVSQGDLFRQGSSLGYKQDFMRRLATVLNEEGGLELVCGVDAGNENLSAGNPDAELMARVLDPFLAILRPAFISTTSSDEEDLNRYVSRVCTVCDSHAGRWHFKMAIDRLWTAGYWSDKFRPYLMSSEPMGVGCQEYVGDNRVGHHVSATANPRDWDDVEAMGVVAAAHYVSRQAYVYMSSPGVISDEPFSNYPALGLSAWLARRLPKNLQSWRVFHGGENRSFSPDRILAVPSDNAARAEHATNGTDYTILYHGESKVHRSRVINRFRGVRINLGTKEESEVSWNTGDIVEIQIRRGTLFLGTRV